MAGCLLLRHSRVCAFRKTSDSLMSFPFTKFRALLHPRVMYFMAHQSTIVVQGV